MRPPPIFSPGSLPVEEFNAILDTPSEVRVSRRVFKYGLFAAILVVGVGLDQLTKWYASERLATQRPGHVDNKIRLTVPESADGKTLEEFIADEFSANDADEIESIAQNWVRSSDGKRPSPETRVEAGETWLVANRTVTVLEGYWEFEYTENPGAAFGLLADSSSKYRLPFFIVVSLLALLMILYVLRGISADETWLVLALSFIATGAVGNFIDRIRFGRVVDFIVWKYTDAYRWPTFNVADAFITVGVSIMLVQLLFGPPPPDHDSNSEVDE